MTTRIYAALGRLTWHVGKGLASYQLRQNKAKIGAGATVLGVLVAGVLAAKLSGDSDD